MLRVPEWMTCGPFSRMVAMLVRVEQGRRTDSRQCARTGERHVLVTVPHVSLSARIRKTEIAAE